jgi:hypothetical protein
MRIFIGCRGPSNLQLTSLKEDKFPNFSKLDTKSQFIWLMSSEDKILIQKVSSLLHSLNEERNNILSK